MAAKKNEIKKFFKQKWILFFALVIVAAIFIWYKSLPTFQEKMDRATWVEHRDERIKYSFEVPDFWQYRVGGSSQYDGDYTVSAAAFNGAYFDIYFYSGVSESMIEDVLRPHPSRKYELGTRTINGVEYRELKILDSAYITNIVLVPNGQNMIIQIKATYPENVKPLSKQQEIEVINRIINSIKKV